MIWNWQQKDWPCFHWNLESLVEKEAQFLRKSGVLLGSAKHLTQEDTELLVVELITGEALKTSEIEGEFLDRDSVQSSILRNFGLKTDHRRVDPAEYGIANMMTDLYKQFDECLSHELLFHWHKMITCGRQDLNDIGCYRTHETPMQVVSGRLDKPKVHFEAPPSIKVSEEMSHFLKWWNNTAPQGAHPLSPLTRAGIAHLYFVSIHPFEDGNGRIGRALAEKVLAEGHGQPSLIALSQTIVQKRSAYYDALENNNKCCEITDWLIYFADIILKAQDNTLNLIDFLIEKTRLYDRLRGQLNLRQEKVIERMFKEGLEGFTGGLSAENYLRITKASRATATRDLQDLVNKGALQRTGERKSTRYWLNIRKNLASQ